MCLRGVRLVAAQLVLALATCTTAFAQDKPPGAEEAQKLIDACWALSLPDRESGNTQRMRRGAHDSAICMEKVILDLTDELFEPDTLTREQMQARLDQLHTAYARFYWDLYNENRGCFCGTMWYVMHNSEYAHLLEKMVRDMIETRIRQRIYPRPKSPTK